LLDTYAGNAEMRPAAQIYSVIKKAASFGHNDAQYAWAQLCRRAAFFTSRGNTFHPNLAKIALEHLGKNQRDYLLVEQNNFHQTNNLCCWLHLRIASVCKNATQKAPEFNRLPNRSTLFDFFDIESKGLTEGHPPGPEPDSRVYWNWKKLVAGK